MKTPMQELMDEFAKKADSLPDTLDANAAYLVFQECYDMAKSMLEKEKEAMVDFAYKCRNVMAADEFAINHWYDKTFNTISLNPTKWSETPNTNQENLPDSTNSYTYYPQENKTVFNTKEK